MVQVQIFNEETGRFEDCKMSVKYENAHFFKESKGCVNLGVSEVDISYLQGILDYAHKNHPDMIGDATFYAIKPSVVKNRNLQERDNWHDATVILTNIFNAAVSTHKDSIIESQKKYYLSTQRNDRWKECFLMSSTDSQIKNVILEHDAHQKEINANRNDMYIIYEASRKFSGVESINFSNVKLDDDKFSSRFDKEFKNYPMLRLLSNVWTEQDRKLVADYIDTVNAGTNAVNVLNTL